MSFSDFLWGRGGAHDLMPFLQKYTGPEEHWRGWGLDAIAQKMTSFPAVVSVCASEEERESERLPAPIRSAAGGGRASLCPRHPAAAPRVGCLGVGWRVSKYVELLPSDVARG